MFDPFVTTGTWVLLIAVAAAMAFGLWRATTDGRFRGTHGVKGLSSGTASDAATEATPESEAVPDEAARESVVAGTEYAGQLGERATLLQFSSAFCAPCRATRRTLEEVAGVVPQVVHLEVDAESHLELVRRLGIMRTPTTLVLDGAGREVTRATGAPSKQHVLSALAQVP